MHFYAADYAWQNRSKLGMSSTGVAPIIEDIPSEATIQSTTQADTTPFDTTTIATTIATIIDTTTDTTTASAGPTTTQTMPSSDGYNFPYPVAIIVIIWIILALAYLVSRWRQKAKASYIIPRVFVLCSPRTVQFHYELILRIGLPSFDFNPEKHDIDLTVQGSTKNEVVPMTRLNTRTLLDEPLITSLSIIVYRLVEMPTLVSLVLKHSGPFKSWVYAYDFTIIDLATNKEQYYTLNQYIGSLDRVMQLEEPNQDGSVHYPIDDVPLPTWSIEDIFLVLYFVTNFILLTVTLSPINCSYIIDIIVIIASAFLGGCLLFFLEWLLYYYLRWNQDRRDYFNEYSTPFFCLGDTSSRIVLGTLASICGALAVYYCTFIDDWRDGLVWLLATLNVELIVVGFWNVAKQIEFSESIVALGMKVRGFTLVNVGMRFAEMVQDMRTKSGSTSDSLSTTSVTSKLKPINTRSSVKSFGFNPVTGHPSRPSPNHISRISSTGATPNNQPPTHIVRQQKHRHPRIQSIIHKPAPITSQTSDTSNHSHHSKENSLKGSSRISGGTNAGTSVASATPSTTIPSAATIASHQIHHKSDSIKTLKLSDKQTAGQKHIERSNSLTKKQHSQAHHNN